MSKLFLIIGFVLSMSTLGLAAATMPPQHTVTAADKSYDSGPLESGGTFSHQFTTPGTYTYQWSNTVYDGHFPSVSSCNSSGCSQNYNALNSGDHDEQVAVLVTDQSTLSQQTLYAYPSTPAVCYNGGFGYYFC